MGRENADSHSLAYCFANPQNPEHKPWRVRARYRDILRAGKEMPECMKAFASEQEGKKDGVSGGEGRHESGKERIKKQMASFGEDLQQFCEEGLSY